MLETLLHIDKNSLEPIIVNVSISHVNLKEKLPTMLVDINIKIEMRLNGKYSFRNCPIVRIEMLKTLC